MKYILQNDNFEVVGKQYLKGVGNYTGSTSGARDLASVINNKADRNYGFDSRLVLDGNNISNIEKDGNGYVTKFTVTDYKYSDHLYVYVGISGYGEYGYLEYFECENNVKYTPYNKDYREGTFTINRVQSDIVDFYITFPSDANLNNVDDILSFVNNEYITFSSYFPHKTLDEIFIPDTIARKSDIKEIADYIAEDKEGAADMLLQISKKLDKSEDDYYPDMHVGMANDLIDRRDEIESTFTMQPTGKSSIKDGNASIRGIKGNSVVLNQLWPTEWERTNQNVTSKSVNGIITSQGSVNTTYFNIGSMPEGSNILNHQYLYEVIGATALSGKRFGLLNRNASTSIESNGYGAFFYTNTDTSKGLSFGFSLLTEGEEVNATYGVRVFDLTLMFGKDNEPTTLDEFYTMMPEGVNLTEYCAGEFINMNADGIKSIGFNQWDGSAFVGYVSDITGIFATNNAYKRTDYIKILPNTSYYVKTEQTGSRWGAWYDKNKTFISGIAPYGLITSPSNAAYCAFTILKNDGTTDNGNIDTFCVNLAHTGYRNGEYESYKENTYDLTWLRKYFPNGMRSAGTAKDEVYFDKEQNKLFAVQRIGEVDLGQFKYYKDSQRDFYKFITTSVLFNTQYATTKYGTITNGQLGTDKGICIIKEETRNIICISDTAYTDSTLFNTAIQGVMMQYELPEPIITEITESVDLDYYAWDFGTEQLITTSNNPSTPITLSAVYGFNAVDTIRQHSRDIETLKSDIVTPDWNASEGEAGYIENRPLFDHINTKIETPDVNLDETNSVSIDTKVSTGFNLVVKYPVYDDYGYVINHKILVSHMGNQAYGRIPHPGGFIDLTITSYDGEYYVLVFNGITHDTIDSISDVRYGFYDGYDHTLIKRIDDFYIPDTIARKSDIAIAIIENEEIVSSALNSLNTDIKQLYKIIEEGEGGVAIGAVSQVATDLYNFKNEVRTGITVHNSERIAGQTIDEIASQLAGASGGLNPWYDSDSKAYIVGIDDDSNAYYSNVYMEGDTLNAPNGFFQQSDENLKTFMSNIEVDLEKIAQLPKKFFMWSDKRDENIHIGTSAQAVQELYPEIVKRDKNGNLTVDYSKLSVIALRAIDVLNEERKQMKADIAEIKNKLGL